MIAQTKSRVCLSCSTRRSGRADPCGICADATVVSSHTYLARWRLSPVACPGKSTPEQEQRGELRSAGRRWEPLTHGEAAGRTRTVPTSHSGDVRPLAAVAPLSERSQA